MSQVSSLERQIEKILEKIDKPIPKDSDYYMSLNENLHQLLDDYENITGKFYIRKEYE